MDNKLYRFVNWTKTLGSEMYFVQVETDKEESKTHFAVFQKINKGLAMGEAYYKKILTFTVDRVEIPFDELYSTIGENIEKWQSSLQ